MPKHPSDLSNTALVFAANLKKLIEFYGESDVQAGKRCKIKQQQMGRLKKGIQAPTLDTVHRVAEGYNLQPFQLLLPTFNPEDLPHAITTRLWHRIQRNIEEARDIHLEDEDAERRPPGSHNHPPRPGSGKTDNPDPGNKGGKKAVPRPRN